VGEETARQTGPESVHDSRSVASETVSQFYEFGPFRLDPAERKLLRGNEIVPLTPKAFDTLVILVRNSGHLLEKDELIGMLWPDTFVEEGSLSNNIFLLRKALGEDPAFIETVPRRGYRFVGAVRQFPRAAPTRLEEPTQDRFQATKELTALPSFPANARPLWRNRAAAGVGAVALLGSLVAVGWYYRGAGRGGETIDSVVVLPFVNVGADPNTEYLSDGITESLINSLSLVPNLKVMSRDSAFHYKGKEVDTQTVGHALGVRAVFKGRVAQRGDTLAISAELIDARDNSHIWGQQYSRKPADIFAIQDEIAKEMTAALRMRLTGAEEKRLTKTYTANAEAYQDYLKGRYWLNKQTEEGFRKGVEYFQQAVAKDPAYALAYSGLADCYIFIADFGLAPPKEAYSKAKEAALTALKIDDALAEAHVSLAYVKTDYEWDWSEGEKESRRAIELNPSNALAHEAHADVLWTTGRIDESIQESKRALELDPLSIEYSNDLGAEFFLARRYDQAIEQEGKVLELDPNYLAVFYFRGMCYLKKSMYKEGMAEFEKGVAIGPDDPFALTGLGYGYAVTGRRAEAQKVLDKLNGLSKHGYVSPVWRAKIYSGLRDKDKAFEWLERAYEDRSIVSVGYLKTNPMFDPLRSDARYADLLRRTNLQP
jgi:TolB-like protein/DNA-binding winged helix-turn-helix (wHTH) protein/Tfp pilus assembly protein PilF